MHFVIERGLKKIVVIPTIHERFNCTYTSDRLCEFIKKNNPDVVFLELPIDFNLDYFNEHPECYGQEMSAIIKAKNEKEFEVKPVEIPFRNEIKNKLEIDINVNNNEEILENERKINIKLHKTLCKIEFIESQLDKLTTNADIPVFTSKRYIKLVKKINGLWIKIETIVSDNIYLQYQRIFNNDIRENIICLNCIKYMKEYNSAILLIGASHINIVKRMRKINKDKTLSINWV